MRILILLLFCPVSVFAIGADDIIRQANLDAWYVGSGITPGDYFTYDICHNVPHLHRDGSCYQIRMDYIVQLQSQGRDVWVVQAEISHHEHAGDYIFLVDSDSLEITTDYLASDTAQSVQDTIFYLSQFAHRYSPQTLQVGSVWGAVHSPFDAGSDVVVSSHETLQMHDGTELDVHIVRYGLFESSIFAVSGNFPFPVYAVAYDPRYTGFDPPVLFSFELLDYSAEYSCSDRDNTVQNGTNSVYKGPFC